MKVAFLGATHGLGRALARRMAARGEALFLLGRDAGELARSARDLEAEGARAPVGTTWCDLLLPETFAPALDAADRQLGGTDTLVLTAGEFAAQDTLEADPEALRRLLLVDFAHAVLLCEEARRRFVERGGGTICAYSSVAGERARKPVALYGAAKAGLSHYLEGLDHRYRAVGLRAVTVKPGFARTRMTAGLAEPPLAADPDDVARAALRGIDRGRPVVYAPPAWAIVAALLRVLPRAVLRRSGF